MSIRYEKLDLKFLISLLACLFIFYPDFFWAQSGFLVADHLWQHYPWAGLLWKSVHQFKLPFWTPLIQCGFPIAAESQIGVFYPINLLIYILLPLHWAHSYMNIIHFILSGWATYFYARQMGVKPLGSFISAFLFLFGASYGGAYYSIASLKTIAWFPLGLFLFERAYQKWKWHYFVYLPFTLSMTLIAGYMQVGILCLFIFAIYALLRIFIFPDVAKDDVTFRLKICLKLAVSMLLTLVLALPQIWLTYQLAMVSNRVGVVEDYAYVGSMFPGAIATVFFPHWNNIFRGNNLYMGIFSVFLILAAFDRRDSSLHKYLKLWCSIGIISLLMALGQWSPLYVAFIKLTHFYSFRTPCKFLIFICLSMALLGGLGFQKLWDDSQKYKILPQHKQLTQRFLALCIFVIFSSGLIFVVFKFGRDWVMKFGDWFIRSFFYGKAGHPHSFEIYHDRFGKYIEQILGFFSPQPWTIWNAGMIFIGVVFSLCLKRLKKGIRIWLIAGFIFLFVDLYSFSYFTFKKGFGDYQSIEINSLVVRYLLKENEKGSVSRVFGFNYNWKLIPMMPSLNMLYGYADIGAYSPFVMKRYYETIGLMGNINDSNFPYWPTPEFVISHLNLFKLTGVSHILSLYRFTHGDLDLLIEDPNSSLYLYRFKPVRSKAFFVSQLDVRDDWEGVKKIVLDPNFDPFRALVIEKSEIGKLDNFINTKRRSNKNTHFKIISEMLEPEFERWRITAKSAGYFVVANSYYPGWRAWVNGKPVRILKAYGLFQAVPITEGNNAVEFRFSPWVLKND